MSYAEKARNLFKDGYNCAQAVVLAFEDVTGLDHTIATKLSASFGGGMGRLREVCGAVSGCFTVLGILMGPEDPNDYGAKKAHYAIIQEAAAKFREANGSYICRDLLQLDGASAPAPEARTEEYYTRRPCDEYVAMAAAITEEMLRKYNKI